MALEFALKLSTKREGEMSWIKNADNYGIWVQTIQGFITLFPTLWSLFENFHN